MIFGYIFSTVGYALFYWGLHHFPFVDGGQRVSLIDCLGIPQAWGIVKGQPIQLNPTGGITPPQQLQNPPPGTGAAIGNLGRNLPATPGGTPKPSAPDCWQPATGWAKGFGMVWKNSKTGKVAFGTKPPGTLCVGAPTPKGTPNPPNTSNCWVLVQLPNFGGMAWVNRSTGKRVFAVAPPGPICPPSTGKAR